MDIRQIMLGEKAGPSQNLIKPVKVQDAGPRQKPEGFYKSIILNVLGVVSALGLGYAYHGYLTIGTSFWFASIALLVLSVFSALQVMVEKSWGRRIGMMFLEAIALVIPFFADDLRIVLIAGFIFFIFIIWGYSESRSELAHGTEIRFFKVTHKVIAKLVTGTLVFMVIFLALMRSGTGDVFVSNTTFEGFFAWGSGVFASFYPTIMVNGSFQDFAMSVVKGQLENNPTFQALSPDEQAQALAQAAAQLTENFSQNLGVSITPSSTTSAVIYNFIVHALEDWQNRLQGWFWIGWGILLFLIVRSIAVIFIWIAQFFAMLFYELLLATRLIEINNEPATKEVVKFL